MSKIVNPKAIQVKSKTHFVGMVWEGYFQVESGTSGNVYNVRVTQTGSVCTCKWGQYRPVNDHRSACSHVMAVQAYIAEEQGRKVVAWGSEEDAKRQRRPVINLGDGVVLTSRKVTA